MLKPYGKLAATASADGTASVTVPQIDRFDSCHSTVFQILEAATCTNSRLGRVSVRCP